MIAPKTGRMRRGMLIAGLSWCVVFLCAMPVEAQRGPGGGGPSRPPRPDQPPRGDQPQGEQPSGSEQGRLVKFKPAKDGSKDEELLGVLSVKAFGKDTKVVRIMVRRSDELKVKVQDHVFDVDELEEVLWRGLYCTASWRLEDSDSKRKRKKKELHDLAFDTLEIEGKVYKIEDGTVIIKGVPKDGRPWPDEDANARSGPPGRRDNKPKRVIRRKVKLKALESLSAFKDAADDEVGLDDFEVGQEVEATVVYGRPYGMVVAMRIPSDGSGKDDLGRDDGDDTGRGGGPRGPSGPRGPGGGVPGGGGRGGGR